MRRWVGAFLVTACVALAAGCSAGGGGEQLRADGARQNPDEVLRPGLRRLLPYDFGPRTLEGLRWLENHATLQHSEASGHRARKWIVRARLDWLTKAYMAPSREERARLLMALMDQLEVPHGGRISNETLFELLDALERQVEGMRRLPGQEEAADSAMALLQVFRHLDRSPPYASNLLKLRDAMSESRQGGAAGEGPRESFESLSQGRAWMTSNALLVTLLDVDLALDVLGELTPDRHSHVLAGQAGGACPRGLADYAGATLEARLASLQTHCAWACALAAAPSSSRSEALASCQSPEGLPDVLYSPDNAVVWSVLGDLAQLLQQVRVVLDASVASQGPLFESQRERVEQQARRLENQLFILESPAFRGQLPGDLALPAAQYAAHPGVIYMFFESREGSLRLSTQPVVRLSAGERVLGWPEGALSAWRAPGHQLADKGVNPLTTLGTPLWSAARAHLETSFEALWRDLDLLLGGGEALKQVVVPALAVEPEASWREVLALAEVSKARGLEAIDVMVWDSALSRGGALRVMLKSADSPEAVVSLEASKIVVRDGSGKVLETVPHVAGKPALRSLYQVLVGRSEAWMGRPLRVARLDAAPEVAVGDVVSVLDAMRFRRAVSGDLPQAALPDAPIEGDGVPYPLVEAVLLSP